MDNFLKILYEWFVSPNSYSEYKQPAEYMFKWPHFLLIFSILSLAITIFLVFRKKSYKTKRKVLVTIAWVIVACEILSRISKILRLIQFNALTWSSAFIIIVPIHFCAIMVWIIVISIFLDNKAMMSFGSIAGLIATIIYMCYPFEGINFIHFNLRAMSSLLTHGLGFVGSLNILLWGIANFRMKDMWKTYTIIIFSVIFASVMNIYFPGNNFMFLVTNPTPLTFGIIPYQIVLMGGVAIIISLFYLIPCSYRSIKMRIRTKASIKNIK